LFPYFRDSYRRSGWDPSDYSILQEILMNFTRAGSNLRPTIFIIDAMDESRDTMQEHIPESSDRGDPQPGVLDLFKSIVDSPGSNIKVLVLSRPKRSIEKAFYFCHHIVLENANAGDIEKIVEIGLRSLEKAMSSYDSGEDDEHSKRKGQDRLPSRTKKPASKAAFLHKGGSSLIFGKTRESRLKEISSIREYLLKNARGVILWVTLIIKELLRHVEKGMYTVGELRAKLATLPLELHDMYSQIVENIYTTSSKEDIAKARRIIVWVVGASQTKTLELQELIDALAITSNLEEQARTCTSEDDPLVSNRPQISSWNHFRRSIYELCGPFIEVIRPQASSADEMFDHFEVEGEFLVQLIHQTATEFLSTEHAKDFMIKTSDAKSIVEIDKRVYLRVALPQFPASYLPTPDFELNALGECMIDIAIYFEQKLLLQYIFKTLPTQSRDHFLSLMATKGSPKPILVELIGQEMSATEFRNGASNQKYIIATFFWIACGKGFDTATGNMGYIIANLGRWTELYWPYVIFAVARVAEMYQVEPTARWDDFKILLDEEEKAQVAKCLLERDIMGSEPQMVAKAVRAVIPF
jgi:hypothetical protein